jgi:hypothetical protein
LFVGEERTTVQFVPSEFSEALEIDNFCKVGANVGELLVGFTVGDFVALGVAIVGAEVVG